MEISTAKLEDIQYILEIERDDFPDPWGEESFVSCIDREFYEFLVVRQEDRIVGYGIITYIFEQAELLNIAVASDYKRKGYASSLLRLIIDKMKSYGVENIFLDVRASNEAAISMYETMGFQAYERTKDFYRTPVEDSIKMIKVIEC